MTYDVLVEENDGHSFQATVLGWPGLSGAGASRQEALDKLRCAVQERLAKAHIVQLEIEVPEEHPWLKLAGSFADNPLFDEVQEDIATYRQDFDGDDEDT